MSAGPAHAAPATRAARVLAVVSAVCLTLSGCLFAPGPPRGADAPGPGASSAAGPSVDGGPAQTPDAPDAPGTPGAPGKPADPRRPVQRIPDVKPRGFTAPPPGAGLQRYLRQGLRWRDCEKLQCATVTVPLDYADPDGQAITLALSRKPATREPRLGSLFINPGGPGVSGTAYVGYFESKGLEQYDIVGWDPRGIGASTPVTCFNTDRLDDYLARDTSPDSATEDAELQAAERAFGRSCLARSGALLAHVSTTETVRDLDVLRSLVSDETLNYFGSSYGTEIGALYAQLFPKRVGRMVLDGAVNITDDKSVSQTEGFERALSSFATWCAAQKCRLGATKEKVLQTISNLFTELDAKPMPGGRRPLSQQAATTGVLFVLYENEAGWQYLQQALELAVVDHDPRYLLFLADQYYQRNPKTGVFAQWNFGFPAVRCLDSQDSDPAQARKDAERDKAKAPTLAVVSGPDYTCPMWPVAPAPKQPKITGPGAAPILVIGTTGDPATPYEYAERMAKQLTSGVLVTHHGEGHLAYGNSSCVRMIVRDYLVKDQVPADGVSC